MTNTTTVFDWNRVSRQTWAYGDYVVRVERDKNEPCDWVAYGYRKGVCVLERHNGHVKSLLRTAFERIECKILDDYVKVSNYRVNADGEIITEFTVPLIGKGHRVLVQMVQPPSKEAASIEVYVAGIYVGSAYVAKVPNEAVYGYNSLNHYTSEEALTNLILVHVRAVLEPAGLVLDL